MGAWAQDPVPGAAAGAALSPGVLFPVPGKMLDLGPGCPRGGARHRVLRPWALGFRILYHILEYYILILYI